MQIPLSASFIQVVLKQSALNIAVEKRNPSLCPQSHFLCEIEVAREDISPISLASLFEVIPDPFIGLIEFFYLPQPLTIFGIENDNSSPLWNRRL